MKLTLLKGIAHDLANYLNNQMWFGHYKDMRNVDTNALEQKDAFDKSCAAFVKERLPDSFDFKRIKKIEVVTDKVGPKLTIKVTIGVDKRDFSYTQRSMCA